MGFLKNLVSAIRGPSFRPTLEAHPLIGPTVAPMKQGNVQPALQLWSASPRDPELRHRLVEVTATTFGLPDSRTALLDAWVNNTPADSFARLVRAKWRVASAPKWRPDDPKEVANRARAANTEAAEFARAELERVAAQSPHDPVPWAMMLALPLVFELDGKRSLYTHVEQRYRGFFPAQLAMHNALSAMWYGDHEQSVGFMRSVSQRAPIGSDLHSLVVYGHFRVYSYEKFYGGGKDSARAYIEDPQNNAEVTQALERSLWNPDYKPGHWSVWARHVAAIWFSERGDKAKAAAELQKVGDAFDDNADPWNVSTDAYVHIRKACGLA